MNKDMNTVDFDALMDEMRTKTPAEGDYTGEDGLIYCGKCRTAKQFRMESGPMEGKLFPRRCKCEQELFDKEQAEQEKRRHAMTVDRLKQDCFSDSAMREWTFANDNGKCAQMDKAHFYVNHFEAMRKDNFGYLLWGGVGTGKSFFAGCIANALMEKEIPVRMTNFSAVMNDLMGRFEGRNEYIARLCRYPLLILDDFGMERETEYALEQVYHVIDSRWRSGKPLIVTTNLSLEQIQNPSDTAHARIYDRLLEICVPIRFEGGSMRKETAQVKMNRLKSMMD
jgi:DNA replication protein DnaC